MSLFRELPYDLKVTICHHYGLLKKGFKNGPTSIIGCKTFVKQFVLIKKNPNLQQNQTALDLMMIELMLRCSHIFYRLG